MSSDSTSVGLPIADAVVTPVAKLTAESETSLFWSLRRLTLRNHLVESFRQARTRLLVVTLLTCALWTVLFIIFLDGFRFLDDSIAERGTHDETIRALFNVFYASLTAMLLVSSGILLYGALYCSDEVRFLLTAPISDERIFVHKFQETMFYGSWAFLLLGTPMLVAFGLREGAQAWYYLMIIPLLLAFAYIPGCLGAMACMLVVRFMPSRHRQLLWGVVIGTLAIVIAWGWYVGRAIEPRWLSSMWLSEFLGRLRFVQYRLLPNWWLSAGLLEALRGGWGTTTSRHAMSESALYLAVLSSNALLGHVLVVGCARWWLRSGYAALHSSATGTRRRAASWIDKLGALVFGWVRPQLRLLMVKDLRLFRRDPVQWSQFLIFMALMTLYFVNSRKLLFDLPSAVLVNVISFLNLGIIVLLLSTFTTRFIFPMISLEGRRFWILGMLPVRRDEILWGKFWLAFLGASVPSASLLLLGDLMLGIRASVVMIHLGICLLLCSGLSGIAVGFGACMPNLRHESPARIAAGFGGTLTLVVSTAYIVAVVVLAAVPCHFDAVMRDVESSRLHESIRHVRLWWFAGMGGSLLLGTLATLIPMRMGLRAFRQLEV